MPNPNDNQQEKMQPTHAAAKVVIPFDIDLSEVEIKLSEIERRLASASKAAGVSDQQPQVSSRNADRDSLRDEADKQLMMSTMMRMADLLRQINDVVLLIYNTQANNG